MDTIIVTNSPGELSGWVRPTVAKLKEMLPQARIVIVIPPCQYASGMESAVASEMPQVEVVINSREYIRWMLLNRLPSNFKPQPQGVVIHMGGDPFHTFILSLRLRFPLVVYTEGRAVWIRYTHRFLVPEERIRLKLINRGVPPKKVVTVGNLMVEGIKPTLAREEAAELWGLDPEADIVALLPGSRPYQVKYMMPFFLKVSELIKQEHPQTQFILALSPFTSKEELASSIQREDVGKYLDGSKGVLFVEPGANGGRIGEIISNEGLEIIVIEKKPYEVMATCDLALTVPGTKTAELACLGISTIVVVPLNKPEKLPIDGFFNWVGEIPLIGPPLKRAVVEALNKRIKFVSHPNIRSEKEIMPEIRGVISPEDISWPAIRLLKDAVERKRMSRQLQSVMGGKGASKRVVEEILAVFSETYSNK